MVGCKSLSSSSLSQKENEVSLMTQTIHCLCQYNLENYSFFSWVQNNLNGYIFLIRIDDCKIHWDSEENDKDLQPTMFLEKAWTKLNI